MNGPNNPIGWCDYTWNPVKGKCPVACPYCYARMIYDRFHYDPTIRLDEKELLAPYKLKEPARIFVGSTIELFGEWIEHIWMHRIIKVAEDNQHLTFQFLTQFPNKYINYIFPDNCWLGVTITTEPYISRIYQISHKHHTKFVSFEPLHSHLHLGYFFMNNHPFSEIDWVIIGGESGNRKDKILPKEEWIQDIIDQADRWKVPVFMKDNLPLFPNIKKRQEFPKSDVFTIYLTYIGIKP